MYENIKPKESLCEICNEPNEAIRKDLNDIPDSIKEILSENTEHAHIFLFNYKEHEHCKEEIKIRWRKEQEERQNISMEESRLRQIEVYANSKKFPADFRKRTFQNYNVSEKNSNVFKIINAWEPNDDFGFLISGASGSGKSHLAFSIINKTIQLAIERKISNLNLPVYYSVSYLLDLIKTNDFKIPSDIFYENLLILDDIGTENITEWSREILYRIFEHRNMKKLSTVVTTNLKPSELKERLHERITSRILGMCIPLEIHGEDRRLAQMKEKFNMIANRAGLKL